MAKQQGKTKYERFVDLSWDLLSFKYMYYVRGRSIIADEAYDVLASEYRELAKELNLNPSADDMVGYNMDKASCRMVAKKMDELYGPV
jgi:NAD-dependent DNA ligase